MPERPAPPALGAWVLHRLCDPRFRDVVEGDVQQLFQVRRRDRGRRYAWRRYWLDVLSITGTRFARGRANQTLNDPDGRGRVTETTMDIIQDLRQAARSLARTPAFSAIVVLTLGLAIGANSTIFSVINGVLLRPLPYDEPANIMVIAETSEELEEFIRSTASLSLFREWREKGRSFDSMAMYSQGEATLSSLDEPVRMNGLSASPALFPLLRVDALHGRVFSPDEEKPGNDDVILLSHRAFQRYFGGDESALGTQLRLDDRSRTLIGVMPPGFEFPNASIEYWVPMLSTPPDEMTIRRIGGGGQVITRREEVRSGGGPGGPGTAGPGGPGRADGGGPAGGGAEEPGLHQIEIHANLVGRLAAGVTPALAAEEGTAFLGGLRTLSLRRLRSATDDSEPDPGRVDVIPMQEQVVGSVRRSLMMLMGAVGFVLLIACANVANLIVARSVERRKETAVRAALGASRWTLTRYLFIESLLLALTGGALGLLLAFGGLRVLAAVGPDFIPRLEGVAIDWRVLGFTVVVSLITAVLFSLVPARGASRLDLTQALKQESGYLGRATGLGRDALRKLLVTAEVALSVVLLVGAGLLVSSFIRLTSVDPGYDPGNLMHLNISLPAGAYPDGASHLEYYDELVRRLEAVPGVLSATIASMPPYLPANIRIAMRTQREGQEAPDEPPVPMGIRMVENAYFQTVGANLVEGRLFNRDDRPENDPVAVMSRSAVKAMFGEDRDPFAEPFQFMGGQQLQIVGIIEDVRTAGVDPTPQADMFLPYRQGSSQMIPMLFRNANVLVRTGPAPLSVLPAMRATLRGLDSQVLVISAATVRDRIADSVAEPRFYAFLVVAFAVLALTLAAVGIYGMLSYTVQQGQRDTAIRRALGAPVGQILRRTVAQGMVLAVIGLVLGVAGALTVTRVLESMLYEIEPTDPASLAAVCTVFLAVALFAVWIPARRATRIDPMDVLRAE